MNQRARKAVGCAFILVYIALYVLLAAALGAWIHGLVPALAAMLYYLVAGIVWIFPLRALFRWMNAPRA